ncbi:putative F-box protein At1g32420 [Papaver somniferum]|uniref:putative F-box protein At1g32420 n=1 Tax=Papaver somniferum TaxID=3469 RepID=UPI000E7029D7|nr:putative F-box protein At1g32420 [Papaver somniferum]
MRKTGTANKDGGIRGKVKTMSQKRRRSNTKEAIQNAATASSSSVGIFDKDIVCDILSRLPAKSIVRFKCVSKYWCTLIQDPYFSDLHFTRSKTCKRLLFIVPPLKSQPKNRTAVTNYKEYPVCFKTADLLSEGKGRVLSTIHTIRRSKSFQCSEILGAVNGLICFIEDSEDAACIFNISTREVTPWIISTLRDDAEYFPFAHGLGFDPATNQYKVICIWEAVKEEGGHTIFGPIVCEVLTLGDNSWRRIDEVPSLPFRYRLASPSVYVNGSIYWLPDMIESDNMKDGDIMFILAIDVGSQKFRKIRIPKFIVDQCFHCHYGSLFEQRGRLSEVNGCLAISRSIRASAVKLWIHDDNHRTSTETGNENWTEHTLTLSSSVGTNPVQALYCDSIAGTNQLILEIHQTKSNCDIKYVSLFL